MMDIAKAALAVIHVLIGAAAMQTQYQSCSSTTHDKLLALVVRSGMGVAKALCQVHQLILSRVMGHWQLLPCDDDTSAPHHDDLQQLSRFAEQ